MIQEESKNRGKNGWRRNNKYAYISTGVMLYSIHIQLFLLNCLLLYLIQYQMIIIKRVKRIKFNNVENNSNSNDTTTTMTTQVEDKD